MAGHVGGLTFLDHLRLGLRHGPGSHQSVDALLRRAQDVCRAVESCALVRIELGLEDLEGALSADDGGKRQGHIVQAERTLLNAGDT